MKIQDIGGTHDLRGTVRAFTLTSREAQGHEAFDAEDAPASSRYGMRELRAEMEYAASHRPPAVVYILDPDQHVFWASKLA